MEVGEVQQLNMHIYFRCIRVNILSNVAPPMHVMHGVIESKVVVQTTR